MKFSRSLLVLMQSLCLLLGIGASCLCAGDSVDSRATSLIEQGDNAYRHNKVAEAQTYYSSALAMLGNDGASRELLAAVQQRLNAAQGVVVQEASVGQRAAARKDDATQQAMILFEEGRQFYKLAQYQDALRQYNAALAALPKSAATDERRQFMVLSIADASVAVAQEYSKVGRYDEARQLLDNALKVDSKNKLALQQLAYLTDPIRNNPAQTPQNVANVNEVNRLLHLGYGYYDLARYDDATKSFEAILRVDPYNTAARNGLTMVAKRKSTYGDAAYKAARGSALTAVDAQWNAPVLELDAPVALVSLDSDATDRVSPLAQKMQDIVLPRLNLDSVDIMEAVDYIRNQAIKYDSNAEHRGFNVMVDLSDIKPEEAKQVLDKRFNLNLQNIPLNKALNYVAKMTGTVVRIGEYAVQLVPTGSESGVLISRRFHLPPAFFSGVSGDDSASGGDDPFADLSATTKVKVRRTDPKQLLSTMGVSFPSGASVNYDAGKSVMYVRNTSTNLNLIEELIEAKASTVPVGIIVKATMIEVSEEVLKELGFEWLVTGNLNAAASTIVGGGLNMLNPTGVKISESIPEIGPEVTKYAPAVTGGLRSGPSAYGVRSIDALLASGSSHSSLSSAGVKAPSILSVRGIWAGADVTMIMRGLDQKKGVNLIQKPSLVVAPGATAVFFSGREFIYPTEYEPAELPQSARSSITRGPGQSQVSTMPVTPSHPGAFEMRQVGTILEVEAQPSEDRSTVDLQITPQIVEFDGFVDYGTPIMSNAMDAEGNLVNMVLSQNRIAMPIFNVKSVTTKLTVATGHTVVLGGLQSAKNVKFEDKVPILGDIPLFGRLFRSEGQEQQRKVLIIMVRADVVDPGGKDARTGRAIDAPLAETGEQQ